MVMYVAIPVPYVVMKPIGPWERREVFHLACVSIERLFIIRYHRAWLLVIVFAHIGASDST